MALTKLQRDICAIISENRIANGESYIAGGVALNALTSSPRISQDIDFFHDTQEALQSTWETDFDLLNKKYIIKILRERASFIECQIKDKDSQTIIQWVRNSAFRFFPLIKNKEIGLSLSPFDLATNKILALVGRLEIREWIDIINCDSKIQPLGYLAWSACGKDPGFNPKMLLNEAARSSHYSNDEMATLSFENNPPSLKDLSVTWKSLLKNAHEIISILPTKQIGTCVINNDGTLFCGNATQLKNALKNKTCRFHKGKICGALPEFKTTLPKH